MNWIETLYPSPAFPRFPDWNTARVGGTHFYAAHAAVNGGYPVVGGKNYGPEGVKPEEDQKALAFMREHVTLVPEKDRAMFSPGITLTLKDGRTISGEYPYERMEWNFAGLVDRLQECLPSYPLGKDGFDRLAETASSADRLDSVAPILAVTQVPQAEASAATR